VVTDPTGTVAARHDYDPFGVEMTAWSDGETHKFTGLERDAESGLDPALFRLYTSQYHRWMTPDPVAGSVFNPQSLNRYAYVLNNPCSLVDPLGLGADDDCTYKITLVPGEGSPLSDADLAQAMQGEIKRIFGLAQLGVEFEGNGSDYTLTVGKAVPSGAKVAANAVGLTRYDSETGVVYNFGIVFQSRIEQFDPATAQSTDFLGIALGRAGAHEVGHYLLGLSGHVSSGLMQASFSGSAWHISDATGQFAFTPAQAAALQKDCAVRHASPGGGGGGSRPGWIPIGGERTGMPGPDWPWFMWSWVRPVSPPPMME
jgi:RHS repeat-associated protein